MARRKSSALALRASDSPRDRGRYRTVDLTDKYAREMGYRGQDTPIPLVSRDASRDPVVVALRSMQRDIEDAASGIDWPKVLVGGAAIAVAGWFAWQHFAPKNANAAPGGSGTIDPTPGIVPPAVAKTIAMGDHVLVRGDFLRGQLPGATFGGLASVRMLVTGINAGAIVGIIEDPRLGASAASGFPLVVPEKEIEGVEKAGGVPASSGGKIVMIEGAAIPVKNGRRYRARLELSTLEAMAANESLVAQQFAALGFENVQAFHKLADLPGDWPRDTLGGDITKAWFVQGDWKKPDATFPRPPQVTQTWEG